MTAASAAAFGDDDEDGISGLLEYVADRDLRIPDGVPLLTIEPQLYIDPSYGIEKLFAVLRIPAAKTQLR